MSSTIRSNHPLKPPKDEIEARLFWHWACLRRNKGYQELWAEYRREKRKPKNETEQFDFDLCWPSKAERQASLPVMIDPVKYRDEETFLAFVRKNGGAAQWLAVFRVKPQAEPESLSYTIEEGISHHPNPQHEQAKSEAWAERGAELNEDAETVINEGEWKALKDTLGRLRICNDPKWKAALRQRYESRNPSSEADKQERETELRLLDDPDYPARLRRGLKNLLEGRFATVDLKVRTDWPVERVLQDVRREIERVKEWRVLAELKPDGGVTRKPKAKKGEDEVKTLAEDLRILDLAKEIERRDGAFPSWAKLAREAYPEKTATKAFVVDGKPVKAKARSIGGRRPAGRDALLEAICDGQHGDRLGLSDEAKGIHRAYDRAKAAIGGAFKPDK